MNNISENSFQNATGKIDYTLMNDYMFRAAVKLDKKTDALALEERMNIADAV